MDGINLCPAGEKVFVDDERGAYKLSVFVGERVSFSKTPLSRFREGVDGAGPEIEPERFIGDSDLTRFEMLVIHLSALLANLRVLFSSDTQPATVVSTTEQTC